MTVLAFAVTLVSGSVLPPAIPPGGPASFRIELQRNADGWAARCDSGCAWESLSYTCKSGCPIVIDEFGVSRASDRRVVGAAFSFRLDPEPNGWRATEPTGTAWREHAKRCAWMPCRAVISEKGVG